ncbi:MAG: hypothetical protein R3290_13770 [Acidimicrobiia bacterium]|nr:hypothetical protein [Acidimicrobiia bacterium]
MVVRRRTGAVLLTVLMLAGGACSDGDEEPETQPIEQPGDEGIRIPGVNLRD